MEEQVASSNINNNTEKLLSHFYKGKEVFLTGATGFVGKVCLIKLLTDLRDVKRIYIVMRPKKGLSPDERFKRMLQDAPFTSRLTARKAASLENEPTGDQIKKESRGDRCQRLWEEARARMRDQIDWSKVSVLEGDMSKRELGLNDEAKEILWSRVNIILNVAASVDFNAPLKHNLRDNYMGIEQILKLAANCKQLISLVHVSTFYTNSHVSHVEERVLPMKRDCEKMAELISYLPDETCTSLETESFMENRPNTYIYTKAMAEELVSKYEGRLPVAIVRPSIIVPSERDPVPAWVDNVNGPMGLGVLASLGILRTIDWNYDGVSDVVPCDYVANSILAVAERTARLHPKELKVYNCSSSSLNPITWGGAFEILRAESVTAPPYKMLRLPINPPQYKRAPPLQFELIKLSELLFAYLIDLILLICGQKMILVKLTQKLQYGYKILKPFTTVQYTCSNDNLIQAFEELLPEDREKFNFDIRKIDWQDYFADCWFGARMAILKEDMSNLQASIRKMKILTVVTSIFKLLMIILTLSLAWNQGSRLVQSIVY